MKRVFLLPLIFSLASCGASETESNETVEVASVEANKAESCEISDANINMLRDQFRSLAKQLPDIIEAGSEVKRPPLEYPFIEPPTVKLSVGQNPTTIDYSWVVRAEDGCKRESSTFESVEFEMTFRDNGRTTTDTANIKLKNKL
ncbi:MAG: hypothetical protein ABJO36_14465 [Litorimonas sp.]